MLNRKPKLIAVVLLSGALFSGALFSGPSTSARGQDSGKSEDTLDQQLLEELGDDLLEGLDDLSLDPTPGSDGDAAGPQDQRLLDELGEGEDIGQPQEDELTRIARQMRQAQLRIEQEEVSSETQQLQRDIVAQLDELIKKLQQQKKHCNSSSASQSSQSNKPIDQPSQPDEGQQPSNEPATDSEERLGQEDAPVADAEALEALVKQVWGHLPDRARQEMQNATVEEFLPKYQEIIEDYYRRLAEQTP